MSCTTCEQAKKALQKVGNIIEGYTNIIVRDNVIEAIANQRKDICLGCEFKSPLVKIGNIQYYSCSKCHCPIDAKTRSTGEVCPIGKW